jgi:Glycosyltransferases involved in cell wall biogenesis
MPKISVIVPAYNVGNYIGEAIQSVLNQTYKDFELLVVNDGSTDHTQDVINTFTDPRIRAINQVNQGVSVARNVGIDNATGEYICFLDGDDRYEPQLLEIMINKITDDLIYCGFYCFGENGNIEYPVKKYFSGNILYENVFKITDFHISSILIKRTALIRSGIKFTPRCIFGQDIEFLYKLFCVYDTEYVAQALVGYRQRPGSVTSFRNFYNKKLSEMNGRKRALEFIKQNYKGKKCDEIVLKIKRDLGYIIYRTILAAIREKKYAEANELLDNNTIDLEQRNFRQRIKWKLMNTRNNFIWKYI